MNLTAPTLETERLRLRAFAAADVPAYAAMLGDEAVMRYSFAEKPLTPEEAWRDMAIHLGHWSLRGFGIWAIEERATGAFVGRTGLFEPLEARWVDLNWMLARPYWGKGYATEAARCAIAWTFAATAIQRLVAFIHVDNERSFRTAERLGLEKNSQHVILERDWWLLALSRPG